MSVWPNRIIILLSWLGIFIASVLSYSKAVNQLVPCSTGGSCQAVSLSEYSSLAGVPVAYLGLGGYLAIMALATVRFLNPGLWKKTALAGFILAAGGVLFSAYLTFMSVTALHTTCEWCLGSAATMLGLFLSHAWLMQTEAPATPSRNIDWGTWGVGLVGAIVGFSMVSGVMANLTSNFGTELELRGGLTEQDVMGAEYKRRGDKDAKVTIVEFADFNCPACRNVKPQLDKLVQPYGKRLRVVFRNFPLNGIPGHESSLVAARISEIAALKGKYWDYVDAVYDPTNTNRIKDAEGVGLRQVATGAGVDAAFLEEELKKSDENSPNVQAVAADMSMAAKGLGLTGTPSFILMATGSKPRLVKFEDLSRALSSEPYHSLLATK